MAEIVIIGAGLTGLSSAYHLEKQNFFDYKIFEKNDRAGGLLQSLQQDGFTFDHTGHLLHINDNYFRSFLYNIATPEDFSLIERKASIFSHNIFSDYPFQINLHGLPTNVAVECIEGYTQRAQHIKKPKTFHEWVLKHFGKGFGKHFFFPYNSKILSYDLKKVHASQTGRFVPSTSLEAIIKGTIEKKPPAGIGYNSSFYYPKQGGIEFVIKQLCKSISSPISSGHTVSHIDAKSKIIYFENGHKEHYHHLITTMPLNQLLAKLSSSSRTPLHQAESKLLHNAVMNINLGFSVDTLSALHWIYFPEKAFPFYRMGFWHNLCPSSVPVGKTAVYGELSYLPSKTPFKKAYQHAQRSVNQMLTFLGLSQSNIVTERILHIDHAYVIYNDWREKNVPKIHAQLNEWGIHSIGRYGEWKYSSMQEAVLDGKLIAQTLKEPGIIPARHDQEPQLLTHNKRFKNLTI